MSQFDGFSRYYQADYGTIDEDVPFYRELARRCGGPILEVMCGSGRLLLPLAQAGYQLTGVDIAPAMLAIAQGRLADADLLGRVTLVEADVTQSLPVGPFGLAIIALNSFMHLTTTTDQLAALLHLRRALRPGGLLAIDLFNPDLRILAEQAGELVFDKMFILNGNVVHKFVSQRTDPSRQLNEVLFLYDELDAQGQLTRTALPFQMRWLYRYELEHLLARAGFELETVYGSYELDDYQSGSELILAVARAV